MFTADGLRPDSPHLVPPRGAAFVLSLCSPLCLAPSNSRPSSNRLEIPASLSFSLALPRVLAFLLARHFLVRSLSVRFTAPRILLSPRASSRLSCGQCKGGESGPRERERISDREKSDSVNGEEPIPGARDQDGDERSEHIHMLERTRMRRGFICKGVVNGGRGHGVGYRPVVSFSFCFHLLCNLVPLLTHHHSPPRRSRSILIYENRLASSFLEIVVFAFTKDRLSLSLYFISLSTALPRSIPFFLSLPLAGSGAHEDGHDDVT